MKPKKVAVANFNANDVVVANKFASYLTDIDEHKFLSWETETDYFELVWYIETEADIDDLPKVITLIEGLDVNDLLLKGIFDFKVISCNK